MSGVIGPAVVAGGRIAAAVLRRPSLKRKASLKLSIEVVDLGGDPVVSVILANPRKNLDPVEVTAMSPMIRIHDQSCGEPEFLQIRRGQYGESPPFPFSVFPGATVKWQTQLRMRDVKDLHKKYTSDAMLKTWGENRYSEFLEAELQMAELLKQAGRKGRLARALHALENPSCNLLYRVSTKSDGEFTSPLFRPLQSVVWNRLKDAWEFSESV
ncbi:hypothetical protein [Cryobacterium sp. TMB1-7]|uniref:hypothetical protein n=1 Tax=Cryobacterium sp. TMB1-7 TaxID=2555866 RepID=UPI001069B03C|nr:hypothetical protein [Cryobacterium sp. TMB1-7]TFC61749.1 hypothetical protein E3O60_04220 [Cryobacterium sp. TMB1-7]